MGIVYAAGGLGAEIMNWLTLTRILEGENYGLAYFYIAATFISTTSETISLNMTVT